MLLGRTATDMIERREY
jgi:hypothetical protein